MLFFFLAATRKLSWKESTLRPRMLRQLAICCRHPTAVTHRRGKKWETDTNACDFEMTRRLRDKKFSPFFPGLQIILESFLWESSWSRSCSNVTGNASETRKSVRSFFDICGLDEDSDWVRLCLCKFRLPCCVSRTRKWTSNWCLRASPEACHFLSVSCRQRTTLSLSPINLQSQPIISARNFYLGFLCLCAIISCFGTYLYISILPLMRPEEITSNYPCYGWGTPLRFSRKGPGHFVGSRNLQ